MPSLEEVDNYRLPAMLVPRIATIHNYSEEYAAKLVQEAKRMLYLYSLTKIGVSPSDEIDNAWHEMILFTRFYKEFSEFIGVFVHHDPTPGQPDGGKSYQRTLENYRQTFDIEPDSNYWTP